MSDEATYRLTDARIGVSTPHSSKRSPRQERMWRHLSKHKDWETFCRLMNTLETAGFTVGADPRISQQYPSLAGDHRYGWKATPQGRLEFKATVYNTGCEIEFFQSVVITNKNGGEYDFDRESKMPYLVRKLYEGTRATLVAHLESRGFSDATLDKSPVPFSTIGQRLLCAEGLATRPGPEQIAAQALAAFHNRWNFPGDRERGNRFPGFPRRDERRCYHQLVDADKVEVEQGDIRYFRTLKGHLQRGLVFDGINGRWCVVFGPGKRDFTYVSTHELFSWRPGLERRRHPKPRELASLLKAAVERQDFERAIVLRNLVSRQSQDRKAAA